MNDEDKLSPAFILTVSEGLNVELDRMKRVQKSAPRCEGARALALSITKLEEALMWFHKIGCHGYEVEG
jgi:hypothetical protein